MSEKLFHWWVKGASYDNIPPSLSTYLSIFPLSHPCSSVTSCCPNVISTLVYKYMIHQGIAHEQAGMGDSFLQDFRAVVFSWEWRIPHNTIHSHRVLGLVIQDNLKWNEHICMIVSKASMRLHIILVLRRGGVKEASLFVI